MRDVTPQGAEETRGREASDIGFDGLVFRNVELVEGQRACRS